MAIAITAERQGYLPGYQGAARSALPVEGNATGHPLLQRARDALHAIHEFPRRHEIRLAESHQEMALQDLRDFASIFQDPSCTIRSQAAREDGLVRFGIYTSTLTGYQKIRDVHVQPYTASRGAEVTISSPMLGPVHGSNVSAVLTLSQGAWNKPLEVTQHGLVSHKGRKRITHSRYETQLSNVLASTDASYRQKYIQALYQLVERLNAIGDEAITAYRYDLVRVKAATSLFGLARTALPYIEKASGVHLAAPRARVEKPRTIGLSQSQIQAIHALHKHGLRGTYEMMEHPSPKIIGAIMAPFKDGAHYIVTTAEKTYFGTVLGTKPEDYLPRYRDGRAEMVHKKDPSGSGIAMTANSDIMDMQTATKLHNIGAKLRQEARDKKAIRDADTSLGRVRTTPPPMRATREQVQYIEPQAQAAAYALFAPPTEEIHQANPRIQFDTQRQTAPLNTSDVSLSPLPFSIPRPFTLAEVNEYLARAPEEPSLPDIPAIMPKSQRNFVSSHMLADAGAFKQGMRARARTLGDVFPISPVTYEPTQPLTTPEVLARHSQVRRPLEEHRRPPRSSTHQLA